MKALLTSSLAVVLSLSCGASESDDASVADDGASPSAEIFLSAVGKEMVLPVLRDFVPLAQDLAEATSDVEQNATESRLAAAQQAWVAAADHWQRLELLQWGPLADMETIPGGEDFRSEIYSWPTSSACFVDQATLAQTYVDPTQLRSAAVNRYGLDAIESLLFAADSDNRCSALLNINRDGQWAALDAAEIQSRRLAYAAAAASMVQADAEAAVLAWDAFEDDVEAPSASDAFESVSQAMNALYTGLLYIDSEVKDMKLGVPAGLSAGCPSAVCPELSELALSGQSSAAVHTNLLTLQWLISGDSELANEPLSFSLADLLEDQGESSLADELTELVNAAVAASSAIADEDMAELVVDDLDSVVAVHSAVQAFTDLFKTQVTTTLNLERVDGQGTDND